LSTLLPLAPAVKTLTIVPVPSLFVFAADTWPIAFLTAAANCANVAMIKLVI
jgi:hypothetical protein